MTSLLVVLNVFLWRLGGAGTGPWREIGWPVLVAFYGFSLHFPLWRILLAVVLAAFAVSRPFTYHGSQIKGHWFNWVWIWILGVYLSGSMLAYGHLTLWPLAWSLAATLSNIPKTAKVFTWEFCECLCGMTVFL